MGFPSRKECMFMCAPLTVFLVIFLCLFSLRRVDFDEAGFVRSRIGGTLDRSKVYENGRYYLSPNQYFEAYKTLDQFVELSDLEVWSRASSAEDAGTALNMNAYITYKVIPARLPELYSKVGFNYHGFVKNVVINAIKNNATQFSADQYLTSRREIEQELAREISAEALDAAGVQVNSFVLGHIDFSETFRDRKVAAAVQNQNNLIETFLRNSTLIRGNTKVDVELINNNATEVVTNAKQEADLQIAKANNQRSLTYSDASREGFSVLMSVLKVSTEKDKLSLHYLINLYLYGQGTGKRLVGFNTALPTIPLTKS